MDPSTPYRPDSVLASTSVDLHSSWLFVELGHDFSMLFHLHPWNGFVWGVLVQVIVCVCDLIESFDGDDVLIIKNHYLPVANLWGWFLQSTLWMSQEVRINGING